MKYNVYIHKKPNNEIFYVGIGSKKRAYCKTNRSSFWKKTINKYPNYNIKIIYKNLTWDEACFKEINLIRLFGRKDLGLGTLVNMTDGGDGLVGYKHSTETKLKMSLSRKGIKKHPRSNETKLKISKANSNKKFTKEHCKKLSLAHKNKIVSDNTKFKMRLSNKNSMILLDPYTGVFYYSIKEYSKLLGINHDTFNRYLRKNKTHIIIT